MILAIVKIILFCCMLMMIDHDNNDHYNNHENDDHDSNQDNDEHDHAVTMTIIRAPTRLPNGLVNVNFGMHGCIHLGTQLPAQVVAMIMMIMILTIMILMIMITIMIIMIMNIMIFDNVLMIMMLTMMTMTTE